MNLKNTQGFDYDKLVFTLTQIVFALSFLYIMHEMKMTELHLQQEIIQQKNEIISHYHRSKGIDVMLMAVYLLFGYLSAPAINAGIAYLKNSFAIFSVKEANLLDHATFSYDSVCLIDISFSECLLWGISIMILCIITLLVYNVWSLFGTRMNIMRVPFVLFSSAFVWFISMFGFSHDFVSYCEGSVQDAATDGGTGSDTDYEYPVVFPSSPVSDAGDIVPAETREVDGEPSQNKNFKMAFLTFITVGSLYLAAPEIQEVGSALNEAVRGACEWVWDCTFGRAGTSVDNVANAANNNAKAIREGSRTIVFGGLTGVTLNHLLHGIRAALRFRYRR